MSLVWSPRSNVFLYGGGTDLTKTTNIPLALAKGINVALAPDWSIGGSQNLLDELRFADQVDNTRVGRRARRRKTLVQMVTTQRRAGARRSTPCSARSPPGKKADVLVIGGDRAAPVRRAARRDAGDVRLVHASAAARSTATPALEAARPRRRPAARTSTSAARSKFVCVAAAGGTATNKLGQTLRDVTDTIAVELQRYDDLDVSAWNFSPPTPLVRCGF